jgi:hypothetical protein
MNGRLAGVDVITPNTGESVYVNRTTGYTTCSISVCNRGLDTALITVTGSDTEDTVDFTRLVEYRTELQPKNVLERTGFIVPPGEYITVESTEGSISVVVMGAETGEEDPSVPALT